MAWIVGAAADTAGGQGGRAVVPAGLGVFGEAGQPAFGLFLVAHLATIVICFAIVPWTGRVHAGYRFLALVADAIEQRRAP